MNRATIALLALLGLAVASPAHARKKSDQPIAVWELLAEDADRAAAEPVYRAIAESLDAVDGVYADTDRPFLPRLRPAEGVVVATQTAQRWLDAGWIAYQRREYSVADALVTDSLALVEPYPDARLPSGLRRDLLLLGARTRLRAGDVDAARETLRTAMLLDPSWQAHPRWEQPELVTLYEEVRGETLNVPPARVAITTSVPDARILIGGIERARSRGQEPVEILLPPGDYEITAAKAGHAPHTRVIYVAPRQEPSLDFHLAVQNTAPFQEDLASALDDPRGARRSDLWPALSLANQQIEARGVLIGRYDGDRDTLELGLYLPGRAGWAFYRAERLDGIDTDRVIEDLMLAVDAALNPSLDEVASR